MYLIILILLIIERELIMQRRDFISTTLGAALALSLVPKTSQTESQITQPKQMIRPKVLSKGDTVGVIASGTAVPDPDRILDAKQILEHFGLKMKLGQYVADGSGSKTRSVKERLTSLHDMFRDEEVKAIFEMRGGYGSPQLLDKIDYDLIRQNPKIYFGFSDITAMHLAIHKYAGLVTFHGPVLLSSFKKYTAEHFSKAIFETVPLGELTNSYDIQDIRPKHPLRMIRSGKATGTLIGGNLSLISNLMGTPYEIDTKGKILFLEETGEKTYRIDRMLTQLRLAGKLAEAAGIIVGECPDCNSSGYTWDHSLGEVLDNLLGDLNIPVLYGLTIGHTSEQLTLPIGVEAELDAERGVLNVLEAGVVGPLPLT